MAYTTVNSIVENVLSDEGKHTTHDFLRLLNIANRGLKELTFDILGDVKIDVIVVDSNLKIDLPLDYVDYTFIGVVNGDYQLEPLAINNRIPAIDNENVNTLGPSEYHYVYGGLFGVGGGQNANGYYVPVIDYDNWQIILGSMVAGQTVYLEYISDGTRTGGLNVVHPYAEEALIAWTYWKSIARKRGYSAIEKQMAERAYYNEKRKARARLSGFTKDELFTQIRKGFKQAPKI